MPASGGLPNLSSYQNSWGQYPADGPKGLALSFSWAILGAYYIDLTTESLMKVMNNLQGVWFDNSKNTTAATLALQGYAGQVITCPASKVILVPVFCPEGGLQATLTSTIAASMLTNLIFLNTPVPMGQIG